MAPAHLIDSREELNLWKHFGDDIKERKRCKKSRHRIARPRGEIVHGQHKVGCKVDCEKVERNENLVVAIVSVLRIGVVVTEWGGGSGGGEC